MVIFNRFRSAGPADSRANKAVQSEQGAAQLIDAGHDLEAQGKLDEAMQCYLDAIHLAPNPARGHLNRGNILLLKGNLEGALDAFRTAIKYKPDYSGAYYNIGNALLRNGQLDEAAANYRSALEIQPDYAEVHCSLGVALKELGQFDSAISSFRRALEINPGLTEAHNNLANVLQFLYNHGNALASNGQLEDAAKIYRQILKVQPDFAEAQCNLGCALQDLGQLDDAVTNFHKALQIKPDLVEAHLNLGIALQQLRQPEDAAASYHRALKIKPDLAEAHISLGIILRELGQLDGAVASYRRALEIKPDFAEVHNNLGLVLQDLGQYEDASASYQKALEIKPDFAEAHCNLGNFLQTLGQLDDAEANYRRALEIKPDFAEAHSNLGNFLQSLGQHEDAIANYRRALEMQPDYLDAHDNLLFGFNYTTNQAPSHRLEQARQYGRLVARKVGARFSDWPCVARPERLRVGLVSGDLRNHVVGHFLDGLLAHIDPARIELIAYPTQHKEEEFTARIRPYFSVWKSLFGKNDEAAAHLIHADGVHVLIDLSGHTNHNRLPVFAWKPAPVQVTWLGYFATTGVTEIDYVLADEVGVPEAQRAQFTESVWYLPDTRLCFTAPRVELPVTPLPALSTGMLTFGCFQTLAKLDDNVLKTWGEIFAALPNAKLRLQCKQLGEPAQIELLLQRLQRYGIAPERVATHGLAEREAYLAAHAEVDVILDTFPYPGGTTTCEALWMGIPTLTLSGDSLLARQGASLLTAAGLEKWVATSRQDYIAKAIALAGDLPKLSALRAGLRQQVLASPLFDAPRFARHFEDALWGMWQRHQDQQANQEGL